MQGQGAQPAAELRRFSAGAMVKLPPQSPITTTPILLTLSAWVLGRWCSLRLYRTIYEQSLGSTYPKSIKSHPHPPLFVTSSIFLSCPMFFPINIKHSLQFEIRWDCVIGRSGHSPACDYFINLVAFCSFNRPPPHIHTHTIQQSHKTQSIVLSRLPYTLTEHEESKSSRTQVIEHLQSQRPGRLASVQTYDLYELSINAFP